MSRRIFCKLLLIVVTIFGLLVITSNSSAQGNRDWGLERAKKAQENHTGRLIAIEGIEGTAIGLDEQDQPVVKVFTARPGVRGIPREIDGVPIKEVVTGKIYALFDPTVRFDRPVPIGVSTGHPNITAGTIGCRVTDGTNVFILSNNHVLANSNNAQIGDSALQPGPSDGGADTDYYKIGELYDFEPIVFGMWGVNIIDAAIASTEVDLVGTSTPPPPEGYGIPSSTTIDAYVGLPVQKYGRTTRLTYGVVDDINGTFLVRYSRSFAIFYGQVVIEVPGFSYGGDSGSLIVTDDDNLNPVALLFAGSDTITIANPIDAVLGEFGVTIDESEGPPPPPDTDPPTPDPMTWAIMPYATGATSIAMEASTASDPSGVEYYFTCTVGGGNDSNWQDSTFYEDTGLSPDTPYTYTVKARDKSPNQNETDASTAESATTETPDTTPPTPDPMTWATMPYATGSTSIAMVATAASDPSGVEYYFTCTVGGGHDSGWQDSASYEDTGLSPGTTYTYTVEARDKSPNQNMTGVSTPESATTETPSGVTVDSISPNTMPPGTTIDVTITGSGFAAGADVTFENGRGPAPRADVTTVVGNTIEATVTTHKNAKPGIVWDVRVTNPDGSTGVLAGDFNVL
jgi:hypothetical protein